MLQCKPIQYLGDLTPLSTEKKRYYYRNVQNCAELMILVFSKKKRKAAIAKVVNTSIKRRASAMCLWAHGWSTSSREGIRSASSSSDASNAIFLLLTRVLTEDCLIISCKNYAYSQVSLLRNPIINYANTQAMSKP